MCQKALQRYARLGTVERNRPTQIGGRSLELLVEVELDAGQELGSRIVRMSVGRLGQVAQPAVFDGLIIAI